MWNAVEHAEKHKKAQLAYSFDIALQNELSMEENIELAREFVQQCLVSKGMIADLAVHQPDKSDGGISNPHFLPRDRTGNRRFLPVMVYPERAQVHILADEKDSRTYFNQMWAEAMAIYRSGNYSLSFSGELNRYLQEHQQDFMQEDTQAGMIYAFLEDFSGNRVCSKLLYAEALGNSNQPADWKTRTICEIMNTGIANGSIKGWVAYKNPKRYRLYGSQKGWERIHPIIGKQLG